jgi:hypothetical protein
MTRRRTAAVAVVSGAVAAAVAVACDPNHPRPLVVRAEAAPAVPAPSARLRKAEVRPAMKAIAPLLQQCYVRERERTRDPELSGVINTKLTIRNEPGVALSLTVNGFDTHGKLGESRDFLACVTRTFESSAAPPVATRGVLEVTYPTTFAPQPPDHRDQAIVDAADRAATEGRWSDALAAAERGLELTSMDGPMRHRLIEVGGLSACHLDDEAAARQYFALASPEFEDELQQACADFAAIDLLR